MGHSTHATGVGVCDPLRRDASRPGRRGATSRPIRTGVLMVIRRTYAAVAAAVVLAGGAHLRAPAVHAQTAATGRVLTITAKDYAFDVPDSVAAGRTEIRLVNKGPELHHAFLIKLEDGKTPADFAQAMQAGGAFPSWARDAGGPNTPAPGKTSVAVLDLKPGTYLLTCVIPSPDGKPHFMKGMSRAL